MARRAVTIGGGLPRWPGTAAAVLVLFLTLGTLVAVAIRGKGAVITAADWAAIRFT
jgi:thiamine transport system permease protein